MQRIVWPIHEHTLFATVTMDVNEALDRVGLASMSQDVLTKMLDAIDSRVQLGIRSQKLPVEIIT